MNHCWHPETFWREAGYTRPLRLDTCAGLVAITLVAILTVGCVVGVIPWPVLAWTALGLTFLTRVFLLARIGAHYDRKNR